MWMENPPNFSLPPIAILWTPPRLCSHPRSDHHHYANVNSTSAPSPLLTAQRTTGLGVLDSLWTGVTKANNNCCGCPLLLQGPSWVAAIAVIYHYYHPGPSGQHATNPYAIPNLRTLRTHLRSFVSYPCVSPSCTPFHRNWVSG